MTTRLRRLLPAALATVTIAASAPFVTPAIAHASDGQRPPHAHAAPHVRFAALTRTDTVRGPRVEGVSAT